MRTLLRFTVPVATGNERILDGTLGKVVDQLIADLKPEAAYFYSQRGERAGSMVFDMKDTSQIPVIAEPLFLNFNDNVEFIPVMNAADLKKAFKGMDSTLKRYGAAAGR